MTEYPLSPSDDPLIATAFWVEAVGRGGLRDEILSPPASDQVLVRTLHSAISRGSESNVFAGQVPVSEYQRMRAPFQAGQFPAPVKYGYASVGVVELGSAALLGKHVFCLHPHQTRYVVPAAAVHPIPASVPAGRAILAANLETAINGLWDAEPKIGDHITVVGGGVVGLLVGWLAAGIPGCRVEMVDKDPGRAALAAKLGLACVMPEQATEQADLVIHASGSASGLSTALRLAGNEATVIEMSWHGDRPVTLALGEAFHSRRLTLRSSQVGLVSPTQRGRWSTTRRLALGLSLLTDDRLDHLIDTDVGFEQLPETMTWLATTPRLCVRVNYADQSTAASVASAT